MVAAVSAVPPGSLVRMGPSVCGWVNKWRGLIYSSMLLRSRITLSGRQRPAVGKRKGGSKKSQKKAGEKEGSAGEG